MARPTKYRREFAQLAENYCMLGATDAELAGFFGGTEVTVNAWKRQHSDFLVHLRRGKVYADALVARKLFERATGYSCPDTKFATHEARITDDREYTKHYPPDTTACIFWLKNRQPARWRDKQEVDHKHEAGGLTESATSPAPAP